MTYHNEFFTPEHFLLACLQDGVFDGIVASKNIEPLRAKLIDLFENGDDQSNEAPEPSFLWRKLESSVALHARGSQVQTLDATHYIAALYTLEQTPSLFAALRSLGDRGTLLSALIDKFSSGEGERTRRKRRAPGHRPTESRRIAQRFIGHGRQPLQ